MDYSGGTFACRHGMGKETLPDGSYYEGHWEHDKPEGKGIMVYPGGDVRYEGHFRHGLPHGQGLMEFTNVSNRA